MFYLPSKSEKAYLFYIESLTWRVCPGAHSTITVNFIKSLQPGKVRKSTKDAWLRTNRTRKSFLFRYSNTVTSRPKLPSPPPSLSAFIFGKPGTTRFRAGSVLLEHRVKTKAIYSRRFPWTYSLGVNENGCNGESAVRVGPSGNTGVGGRGWQRCSRRDGRRHGTPANFRCPAVARTKIVGLLEIDEGRNHRNVQTSPVTSYIRLAVRFPPSTRRRYPNENERWISVYIISVRTNRYRCGENDVR